MTKPENIRLLLAAGRKAVRGVSRGTVLIFRCPVCGADRAAAVKSKTGSTLAVRCTSCKLTAYDRNYKEDEQ
ncbi:MAG: hypothetical protein E7478_07445 [Ruminococcaceae bacterium]|nr:hypothetical protein [Oscillospiraceae bacterium]